jgi:hypothetical protein
VVEKPSVAGFKRSELVFFGRTGEDLNEIRAGRQSKQGIGRHPIATDFPVFSPQPLRPADSEWLLRK